MTVTDPHHLWRLQLALECKTFDGSGRLVPVPCADPDPLHACYAVRYSDGATELVFAASTPEWVVQQVDRFAVDDLISRPASLAQRLRTNDHHVTVDHFHTYCFSGDVSAADHPALTRDATESHSIVLDGRRVAGASSSRSDGAAAELWIETDPAHRRHGYATALARAWAADVRHAGKIAFYSHLHDNRASAALARRLGVRPLFEIVALNLEKRTPTR